MNRKWLWEYCFYLVIFCAASTLYYSIFTTHLLRGQADLPDFNGVIINDSLMYDGSSWVAIKAEELTVQKTLLWLKEYPTLLPMTLLTFALNSVGINPLLFNIMVVTASSALLLKLAQEAKQVFPRFALISLLVNSAVVFYAQSYSKEILLIFACCLATYGVFKGRLLWIILAIFLTALIRVPLAVPMFGSIIWLFLAKKYPSQFTEKRALIVMALLMVSVPLLYSRSTLMIAAQDMLRHLNTQGGITFYYFKMIKYPLIPLLFLPFRIVQNLFEPILAYRSLSLSPPYPLSSYMLLGAAVIHCVLLATLLAKRKIVKANVRSLVKLNDEGDKYILFLLIFSSLSVVMFALLPFVQIRYLLPLAPGLGLIIDLLCANEAPN